MNEANNIQNTTKQAVNYTDLLAAGRLSKSEAKEAMKENLVAHRFFSEGEYVYAFNDFAVFTEEGYSIDADTFWADRSGDAWDTDWFIVPEPCR